MTIQINRNRNESSCILMYMIIEECDHIRCKDNNDNINIENDIDKIIVTTVILGIVIIIEVKDTISTIEITRIMMMIIIMLAINIALTTYKSHDH